MAGDFSRSLSQTRPLVEAELRDIDAEEWSDVSAMCLREARPLVEAEHRDMDPEERSDVSARSLNERSLLG